MTPTTRALSLRSAGEARQIGIRLQRRCQNAWLTTTAAFPPAAVLRGERPPGDGGDAEDVEELARDGVDVGKDRSAPPRIVVVPPLSAATASWSSGARASRGVRIGHRDRRRLPGLLVETDDAIGFRVGQRPQQHAIDDAGRSRCWCRCDREGQDGDECEWRGACRASGARDGVRSCVWS